MLPVYLKFLLIFTRFLPGPTTPTCIIRHRRGSGGGKQQQPTSLRSNRNKCWRVKEDAMHALIRDECCTFMLLDAHHMPPIGLQHGKSADVRPPSASIESDRQSIFPRFEYNCP